MQAMKMVLCLDQMVKIRPQKMDMIQDKEVGIN